MGLTIHWNTTYKGDNAEATVAQVRQLAMDLPFEWVSKIHDLRGKQCDIERRREAFKSANGGQAPLQGEPSLETQALWSLLRAGTCNTSVKCPWNKRLSRQVNPSRLIGFTVIPGPGCEPADFGLALYPETIDWPYNPREDARFQERGGDGWGEFSWKKFGRWCERQGKSSWTSPSTLVEPRTLPLKLGGWRLGSFCKTQYANHPSAGGIANFMRCHISLITWLERAARLPGLKVKINDEGKYGPSFYTDDPQAEKRVYTWHKGKYSPVALANEVGEWNSLIAGFSGALSDALAGSGVQFEAPIKDFSNFEQLEFKGQNLKYLEPFLKAMKALSVRSATVEQRTA